MRCQQSPGLYFTTIFAVLVRHGSAYCLSQQHVYYSNSAHFCLMRSALLCNTRGPEQTLSSRNNETAAALSALGGSGAMPGDGQSSDSGRERDDGQRRARCASETPAGPSKQCFLTNINYISTHVCLEYLCDKQVSSWRHISCHTDKNTCYSRWEGRGTRSNARRTLPLRRDGSGPGI